MTEKSSERNRRKRIDHDHELPGTAKTMETKTGGGDHMRTHHLWWFDYIPATTRTDGISNNWWESMVDPNVAERGSRATRHTECPPG